jgi:hypothetical protein
MALLELQIIVVSFAPVRAGEGFTLGISVGQRLP